MDQGPALVNALLYGRMESLPPETIALFARTGLIHLFSASGFHVGAAIQLARLCTRYPERWCRHRRGARLLALSLQLSFMLYFGHATGWSSPMVRALTFTALRSAARFLEIRPSPHWVFLLSLLLSALLGRGSFLSFLLSAGGMAGVLYVRPRGPWAITLGPWLLTLPVIIWVFGLFSGLAPLWNLTIGFLVSWLVMPPAILHLICRQLPLPDPFLPAAAFLMELLTGWLDRGDSLLGGAFWVPRGPWIAAVAALFAATLLPRKRRPAATAAIACALFLLRPVPRLAVLDVGQGDSIFFRTRDGARLLMDAGPPGRRGREARTGSALGRAGIGALDELLLSHPDLDHRGGIESVLRNHRVRGSLWLREEALGLPGASAALAAAERAGLPVRFLSEASHPANVPCYLAPARSANDLSPLCIADLPRGARLWLTGDMSGKAEAWLLARHPGLPPADFLKVAHHGSRTSSTEAFLRASGAREALVSVGAGNRYGHPAPEVSARLSGLRIGIRRTDRDGTLVYY